VVVPSVVVAATAVVVEGVKVVVVDAVPPEHAPATTAKAMSHEPRDRTQTRYPRETWARAERTRDSAAPSASVRKCHQRLRPNRGGICQD
jgi:hypothetical protein